MDWITWFEFAFLFTDKYAHLYLSPILPLYLLTLVVMTTDWIFIVFRCPFLIKRGGNNILIYLSSLLTTTTPKERIKSDPCLPQKPKPFENVPFGQSDCTTNLSTDYQKLINYEVMTCASGLDNSIFSNGPYWPRQMPVFPQWKRPAVLTLMAPFDALTHVTQFSDLEHLITFVLAYFCIIRWNNRLI